MSKTTLRAASVLLMTTAMVSVAFAAEAPVKPISVEPAQATTGVGRIEVRGAAAGAGQMIPEEQTKQRTTVTREQLELRTPSVNPFEAVKFAPNALQEGQDSTGASGGALTVRGFSSDRLSLTINGVQLNDLGNSAVFPLQQPDRETLQEVFVVNGSADVDTPSAISSGGQIGQIIRFPNKKFGAQISYSHGDHQFNRFSGVLDTGEIIDGLTAFGHASYLERELHRGRGGQQEREQYNTRLRYDIGQSSFVSIYGSYTEGLVNQYRAFTKETYDQFGYSGANACNNRSVLPGLRAPSPGVGVNESTAPAQSLCGGNQPGSPTGNNTTYFGNQLNPFYVGWLTANSSFQLTDSVRLDVTPAYYYVRATGGTNVTFAGEGSGGATTGNIVGRFGVPFDLNGDGDTLDTVMIYQSNHTRTDRPEIQVRLTWDLNEDHKLVFQGVYQTGRHRQTGPGALLNPDGTYNKRNPFYARDAVLVGPNGNTWQSRNRLSRTTFTQIAAEWRGQFLEDALDVNVGLRLPEFSRDVTNFCWTGTTTSCLPTSVALDRTQSFDELLPTAGARYQINPEMSVFASYARSMRAPDVDALYDDRPDPDQRAELSDTFEIGYRYQTETILVGATGFLTSYKDFLDFTFDPDAGVNRQFNVGDVEKMGFELEAGVKAWEHFGFYGSLGYIKTEVQSNRPNGCFPAVPAGTACPAAQITFLPTQGKELVRVPNWTGSLIAQYDNGSLFGQAGLRYVGERFGDRMNFMSAPSYTTVDLTLGYRFDFVGKPTLRLFVNNLFDEDYLAQLSGVQNTAVATAPVGGVGVPPVIGAAQPTWHSGEGRFIGLELVTNW